MRKGQLLAQLDTADLRAQLQSLVGTVAANRANTKKTSLQSGLTILQNNNSIDAARASVAQAQQTLSTDTLNLNRDAQLLKQGYIAQAQYDQQNTLVANDQQAVQIGASEPAKYHRAGAGQRDRFERLARCDRRRGPSRRADRDRNGRSNARADREGARSCRRSTAWSSTATSTRANIPARARSSRCRRPTRCSPCSTVRAPKSSACKTGAPVKIISSDQRDAQRDGAGFRRARPADAGLDELHRQGRVAESRRSLSLGHGRHRPVPRPASRAACAFRVTAFVDDIAVDRPDARQKASVKTIPVTMVAEDGKNAVVQGLQAGQKIIANGQLGLSDGQPAQPLTGKPARAVAER